MYKSRVSIILSIVFVLFLSAPTIIMVFDVPADTSVFFSVTEEENESSNVSKQIQAHITLNHKPPFDVEFSSKKASNFYLVGSRSSLSLQTFSPPPEQQV
ncbi:hypothetical protein [Paucihalobacter sp.]|uniref:hypothetical protein n=1 Tax=Paucihalobacter sp. TaxID=2850405 RepID=UPI002FE2675F